MRPSTLLAQLNGHVDPITGGLTPSIHPGVTYAEADGPDGDGGLELGARRYGRVSNPGAVQVEALMAKLEGGRVAAAFSSGCGAAQAVLATLSPGDHLLLDTGLYYEFGDIIEAFGARWGVVVTRADLCDLGAVQQALRPGVTRWIWAECPSNPFWRTPDIAALASLAHDAGACLLVDATVATPVLCQPLQLGADLVLHSATKYLSGHGDLLAGVLVAESLETWPQMLAARAAQGTILPPFEAWLLLRGLRTLAVRMSWACASAQQIAAVLADHPGVERVHYPGLAQNPHHALASRQFSGGFCAMLSFEVRGGGPAALAVCADVRLFRRSTSLGSTESLIEHRRSTEGQASLCPPSLVRLSIGLEDTADLIADIVQALDLVRP